MNKRLSRREFIKGGAIGLLGVAGIAALGQNALKTGAAPLGQDNHGGHGGHNAMPTTVGEVDHQRNGFDPSELLTDFDYGEVSAPSKLITTP